MSRHDDPPGGPGGPGPGEPGDDGADRNDAAESRQKLDEDAAWRAIVDNYGDRPTLDEPLQDPEDRTDGPVQETPADPPVRVETPTPWEDEGHFVPPDPPPPPLPEPRRRLAWAGLFGGPLLMLLVAALGWTIPGWALMLLVVAFVGGFGYLVATMPRGPGDGGDSYDDGAVV